MTPQDRIIVALDRPTTEQNLALIEDLSGAGRFFKVGMRQYYAGADKIFAAIQRTGAKLFLDLKLHDIPATVAGAMQSLSPIAPDLITLHAGGGAAMVRAAVDTLREHAPKTKILAVTILTSMDADDVRGLTGSEDVQGAVLRLAKRAVDAGAHGVVASPLEAAMLREALGDDALIVTPGVRPKGADLQDQRRVMTPEDALDAGADYLVIGRPIHGQDDPRAAFQKIVDQLR